MQLPLAVTPFEFVTWGDGVYAAHPLPKSQRVRHPQRNIKDKSTATTTTAVVSSAGRRVKGHEPFGRLRKGAPPAVDFYGYVLNNPVNLIDPVGLAPWPYDLYEKARKKLKKADCVLSAAACKLLEDVNSLNSMSNDAITNTAEAQQNQGNPNAGDLGMQRVQLCLAADQNCKNALEKCIKLALTNPFPPPSWLSDLINYFSKNPSTPAPPIKRE
jgi:hypothetical protein